MTEQRGSFNVRINKTNAGRFQSWLSSEYDNEPLNAIKHGKKERLSVVLPPLESYGLPRGVGELLFLMGRIPIGTL
jgi:hypothetical protein